MTGYHLFDRRVQTTKMDISEAFLQLLKDKKYEIITTKEIIEKAGYSRATFYVHYKTKHDLLQEIIHYLFEGIQQAYRMPYKGKETLNIGDMFNEPIYILQHMQQYKMFYQILLSQNLQIDFRQKLTEKLLEVCQSDFEIKQEPLCNQLMNHYLTYGSIGLILDWLIKDCPIEIETFARLIVEILQSPLDIIKINP